MTALTNLDKFTGRYKNTKSRSFRGFICRSINKKLTILGANNKK